MPAKPRWLLNIPAILASLSALESPVIDRAMCEKLFGLRRRRANDLMRQFGGYQAGNTILLDKVRLVQTLLQIEADPETDFERHRKERLSEQLNKLHRHRAATQVRIEVPADVHHRRLKELPSGVQLEARRLTIDFASAEQLLTSLYEFSQAVSNDYELFCSIIEPAAGGQTDQSLIA
jgi:hypothetical protein